MISFCLNSETLTAGPQIKVRNQTENGKWSWTWTSHLSCHDSSQVFGFQVQVEAQIFFCVCVCFVEWLFWFHMSEKITKRLNLSTHFIRWVNSLSLQRVISIKTDGKIEKGAAWLYRATVLSWRRHSNANVNNYNTVKNTNPGIFIFSITE